MELIKLNEKNKEEVLRVWEIAFEEDELFEDKLCQQFFSQSDLWHYTYGWLDSNKLISTYITLDVDVVIRGCVLKGHYIDGIATLPDYRRCGLVHKQMYEDAMRCKKLNIPLMLVDPSRDSFYRKFGFEFAMNKYSVSLERSFFSKSLMNPEYTVITGGMDNKTLQESYQMISQWLWKNSRYNEMKWPPCYEDIKYKRQDIQLAVAYDKDKSPLGYMLYAIDENRMFIESIRYTTLNALYALKNYMLEGYKECTEYTIKSMPQDFPLDVMLHDIGRPEKRLNPYSCITRMIRVVDFQKTLEQLMVKKPQEVICIKIEDSVINDNDGFYTVWPSGDVTREAQDEYIISTIANIVPLLSGLKSAEELYYNGKISVEGMDEIGQGILDVPKVIKHIGDMLPKSVTYNADEYLAP